MIFNKEEKKEITKMINQKIEALEESLGLWVDNEKSFQETKSKINMLYRINRKINQTEEELAERITKIAKESFRMGRGGIKEGFFIEEIPKMINEEEE